MQLVITLPADVAETKGATGTYPFVIDRWYRSFPVEPRSGR